MFLNFKHSKSEVKFTSLLLLPFSAGVNPHPTINFLVYKFTFRYLYDKITTNHCNLYTFKKGEVYEL